MKFKEKIKVLKSIQPNELLELRQKIIDEIVHKSNLKNDLQIEINSYNEFIFEINEELISKMN